MSIRMKTRLPAALLLGTALLGAGHAASTVRGERALDDIVTELPAVYARPPETAPAVPALDAPREALRRALVRYLAPMYGEDRAALVTSLIYSESSFRLGATSHVGAKGLMQLMEGTAEDMGLPAEQRTTLQAVPAGVRYLNRMVDLADGDVHKALQAYNAGPGNIFSRKRVIPSSVEYADQILERVPEHRRYVRNVLREEGPLRSLQDVEHALAGYSAR